MVQVNTLEGRPAASSGLMHEAPTAPDVHQEHFADAHEDSLVFCSQLDAAANDAKIATIATTKVKNRPYMIFSDSR